MNPNALFNPLDWYWKADDGRVFSSGRTTITDVNDAGYKAFVSLVGPAPRWPYDDANNQTKASLQAAIGQFNLFVDLKAYAASVRYTKEVSGVSIGGSLYPSDRETQAKLTAAALFAQVDNTQTFKWKLQDGSFSGTLNASQMVGVAATIGAFVNDCFATEATVQVDVDAGTITTRAQVDAAFV